MLLHVLIFQSNDDSVINQGRIVHTGTTYMHVLFRRFTMNLSSVYLFFYGKKRTQCSAKDL